MKDKTTSTMIKRNAIYAGVVAALALQTPAMAQERQLEEVIVTAQKRTESLQDVPISVTAISAQDLEEELLALESAVAQAREATREPIRRPMSAFDEEHAEAIANDPAKLEELLTNVKDRSLIDPKNIAYWRSRAKLRHRGEN